MIDAARRIPTFEELDKTAEPTLRWAGEADRPQLIELTRAALGEGAIPRTEAFWRWKHEQNPFGASPVMVAAVEGRIVSLRTFLRWRWRLGERRLQAVRPVDTATHPDWRRRGLFERLTRELIEAMRDEGIAFVFNTPNPRSGQGYQKLGWRMVGRPTILIRPQKPVRLLRSLWHRRQEVSQKESQAAKTAPVASTAALDSPDLDAFLANLAPLPDRLATDAAAAYLRWRYRDCPGLGYGADGAFDRRSGALLAYRRTHRSGLRELRICDLFVAEDKASRRKAKDIFLARLAAEDADFVSARATPGAPMSVLRACGFLPVPRIGPVLAVRPLAAPADLPAIGKLSTFGATIGALELF